MVQIPIDKQQAVRAAAAAAMGGPAVTTQLPPTEQGSSILEAAIAEAPDSILDAANEITDPMTGEIYDVGDIDGLIDLFERRKAINDQVYSVLLRIRTALANLTEGDAVTRRVRGKRRQAKITMPDVSFEQSVLKELWNSHPALALQYLKIESIGVRMKEYKKLVDTSSSEPDFVFFRDALTRACRGRVGTPSVSVEG